MITHDDMDRALQQAIRSYEGSVQPPDRLGEIRARTRGAARAGRQPIWWGRPWLLACGAALVATAVVFGAMWAAAPSSDDVPPVASTTEAPVTIYTVGVYGQAWLFPADVPVSGSPADNALGAVDALLETVVPGRTNLWAGLPGSVTVNSVHEVGDRVVVVDFSGPVDDPFRGQVDSAYDEKLVLQQLAFTVQEASGGTDLPVAVTRDGEPVDSVLGIRVGPQPISADPSSLSPVLIDAPKPGQLTTSPVTLSGTSDTFEANVAWEVLQDEQVVERGATMGGSYGKRQPWEDKVRLAPGDYTVRVYEVSAEDGSLRAEDTVDFRVG